MNRRRLRFSYALVGLACAALALGCKTPKDRCLAGDAAQCEALCPPGGSGLEYGVFCQRASVPYTKGNPPDFSHESLLLERACDGQASDVCVALGDRYRLGDRAPRSPSKAAALYKKACDQPYLPGCEALKKIDAK